MNVAPENKLLIQELNKLIGINLLTSGFLENLVLSPNFQGGRQMPVLATLRRPVPAGGTFDVAFTGLHK